MSDWSDSFLRRPQPHSLETERTVLGMMLYDSDSAKRVLDALTPADFYDEKHGLIFGAAGRAFVDSGSVDVLLVTEQIRLMGKDPEVVGGVTGLTGLADGIATVSNLDHHLRRLRRYTRQRQLISVYVNGLSSIYDHGELPDDVITKTRESLVEIGSDNGDKSWWRGEKFLKWTAEDPNWIVEPFIAPKDVFFLSSDAGVGKTWLLSAMMLEIAAGKLWLGRFSTRKVRCLYADFDGHGDGDALRRRLRKIAEGMGVTEPFTQLEEQFGVMTRYHLPQAINLFTGNNIGLLKREIENGGFRLCFIDTFASVHGSDNESDSGKMAQVMNRLRALAYETGCAFAIAHHHRKESQFGSDSAGSRYRGSTAIKAGADSMVEMRREHSGIIRCCHSKPRHVKALDDFAVSISDFDAGVVIQCEDDEKLATARQDDAAKWILNDLWRLESDEFLPQSRIVELAHDHNIASDRYVRQAITRLESRGLLVSRPGNEFGKDKRSKYWALKGRSDE